MPVNFYSELYLAASQFTTTPNTTMMSNFYKDNEQHKPRVVLSNKESEYVQTYDPHQSKAILPLYRGVMPTNDVIDGVDFTLLSRLGVDDVYGSFPSYLRKAGDMPTGPGSFARFPVDKSNQVNVALTATTVGPFMIIVDSCGLYYNTIIFDYGNPVITTGLPTLIGTGSFFMQLTATYMGYFTPTLTVVTVNIKEDLNHDGNATKLQAMIAPVTNFNPVKCLNNLDNYDVQESDKTNGWVKDVLGLTFAGESRRCYNLQIDGSIANSLGSVNNTQFAENFVTNMISAIAQTLVKPVFIPMFSLIRFANVALAASITVSIFTDNLANSAGTGLVLTFTLTAANPFYVYQSLYPIRSVSATFLIGNSNLGIYWDPPAGDDELFVAITETRSTSAAGSLIVRSNFVLDTYPRDSAGDLKMVTSNGRYNIDALKDTARMSGTRLLDAPNPTKVKNSAMAWGMLLKKAVSTFGPTLLDWGKDKLKQLYNWVNSKIEPKVTQRAMSSARRTNLVDKNVDNYVDGNSFVKQPTSLSEYTNLTTYDKSLNVKRRCNDSNCRVSNNAMTNSGTSETTAPYVVYGFLKHSPLNSKEPLMSHPLTGDMLFVVPKNSKQIHEWQSVLGHVFPYPFLYTEEYQEDVMNNTRQYALSAPELLQFCSYASAYFTRPYLNPSSGDKDLFYNVGKERMNKDSSYQFFPTVIEFEETNESGAQVRTVAVGANMICKTTKPMSDITITPPVFYKYYQYESKVTASVTFYIDNKLIDKQGWLAGVLDAVLIFLKDNKVDPKEYFGVQLAGDISYTHVYISVVNTTEVSQDLPTSDLSYGPALWALLTGAPSGQFMTGIINPTAGGKYPYMEVTDLNEAVIELKKTAALESMPLQILTGGNQISLFEGWQSLPLKTAVIRHTWSSFCSTLYLPNESKHYAPLCQRLTFNADNITFLYRALNPIIEVLVPMCHYPNTPNIDPSKKIHIAMTNFYYGSRTLVVNKQMPWDRKAQDTFKALLKFVFEEGEHISSILPVTVTRVINGKQAGSYTGELKSAMYNKVRNNITTGMRPAGVKVTVRVTNTDSKVAKEQKDTIYYYNTNSSLKAMSVAYNSLENADAGKETYKREAFQELYLKSSGGQPYLYITPAYTRLRATSIIQNLARFAPNNMVTSFTDHMYFTQDNTKFESYDPGEIAIEKLKKEKLLQVSDEVRLNPEDIYQQMFDASVEVESSQVKNDEGSSDPDLLEPSRVSERLLKMVNNQLDKDSGGGREK